MTGFSPISRRPSSWFDRRSVLVVLAFLLAFGFWFAHLQWWWKANDDSTHQYFNALKLSHGSVTSDLNDQALVAMERGDMDAESVDRLKLRVAVTYNWLLTSLSINAADRFLGFAAAEGRSPHGFPEQLVASEITGFLVVFTLTTFVLVLAVWARFDLLYLKALVAAFALMLAMALLYRTVPTEFTAVILAGAALLFAAFRRFGLYWGFGLLALLTFVVTYGILDALVASEVLDAKLGEIVQPEGGLFEFVTYSLDTLLYPKRCCSPFGYFARSNFNLLLILVFALRWSGRYAACYLLLAAMSLIHVAQSGLVVFLLLGADLLLRPGTLVQKQVLAAVSLSVTVFLVRQASWPSFTWFSDHGVSLLAVALAIGLSILAARKLARWIKGVLAARLTRLLRLHSWLLRKGPIVADILVVGFGWLGLSLLLFTVVKWLGRDALEEMSYLSRVSLTVTPRRLLSALQAPAIFGIALLSLGALERASESVRLTAARWLPCGICLMVLAVWGNNLVQAGLDSFPARQVEEMAKLHRAAQERPPYPDRDFDEARMYYLMALYTRDGHYVPNGFFKPVGAEPD